MNNWFTVKVKYTKQLENGCFKRVQESYLVAADTFGDAEARIYEELGSIIRSEFKVADISKMNVHDIFHYQGSDDWYQCTISYTGLSDESDKPKTIKQTMLVTAHSVEDASLNLKESLQSMMVDFTVPLVKLSNIVDVFPYNECKEESHA